MEVSEGENTLIKEDATLAADANALTEVDPDDEMCSRVEKKRRRVSFAEKTHVRIFEPEDEEIRCESNENTEESRIRATSGHYLSPILKILRNDDGDDEIEMSPDCASQELGSAERNSFDQGTPTEEGRYFGPVSAWHIEAGISAPSPPANDITMDSETFTLEFRKLIRAHKQHAGVTDDTKTSTMEANRTTDTVTTITPGRDSPAPSPGSSMVFTTVKEPIPPRLATDDTTVESVVKSDISFYEEKKQEYNFESMPPDLASLLKEKVSALPPTLSLKGRNDEFRNSGASFHQHNLPGPLTETQNFAKLNSSGEDEKSSPAKNLSSLSPNTSPIDTLATHNTSTPLFVTNNNIFLRPSTDSGNVVDNVTHAGACDDEKHIAEKTAHTSSNGTSQHASQIDQKENFVLNCEYHHFHTNTNATSEALSQKTQILPAEIDKAVNLQQAEIHGNLSSQTKISKPPLIEPKEEIYHGTDDESSEQNPIEMSREGKQLNSTDGGKLLICESSVASKSDKCSKLSSSIETCKDIKVKMNEEPNNSLNATKKDENCSASSVETRINHHKVQPHESVSVEANHLIADGCSQLSVDQFSDTHRERGTDKRMEESNVDNGHAGHEASCSNGSSVNRVGTYANESCEAISCDHKNIEVLLPDVSAVGLEYSQQQEPKILRIGSKDEVKHQDEAFNAHDREKIVNSVVGQIVEMNTSDASNASTKSLPNRTNDQADKISGSSLFSESCGREHQRHEGIILYGHSEIPVEDRHNHHKMAANLEMAENHAGDSSNGNLGEEVPLVVLSNQKNLLGQAKQELFDPENTKGSTIKLFSNNVQKMHHSDTNVIGAHEAVNRPSQVPKETAISASEVMSYEARQNFALSAAVDLRFEKTPDQCNKQGCAEGNDGLLPLSKGLDLFNKRPADSQVTKYLEAALHLQMPSINKPKNLQESLTFVFLQRPQVCLLQDTITQLQLDVSKMQCSKFQQSSELGEKLILEEHNQAVPERQRRGYVKWLQRVIAYEKSRFVLLQKRKQELTKILEEIVSERSKARKLESMFQPKEYVVREPDGLLVTNGRSRTKAEANAYIKHLEVNVAKEVDNFSRKKSSMEETLKKIQVEQRRAYEQAIIMKQELEVLGQKTQQLCEFYCKRFNMDQKLSTKDVSMLIENSLKIKSRISYLHQDMQPWKLTEVKNSSGYSRIDISYGDIVHQRLVCMEGKQSARIVVSLSLNHDVVEKVFPSMDASYVFRVVFDSRKSESVDSVNDLWQVIKETGFLYGTLLDILEELRSSRARIRSLSSTRFYLTNVRELHLQLNFMNFITGVCAKATLGMESLFRGMYPLDAFPLEISTEQVQGTCDASSLSEELSEAISTITPGYMRLEKICDCISRLLEKPR